MRIEPTPSQSTNQDFDWEKAYLDTLGANPNSPRAMRSPLEKLLRRIVRRFMHPEDSFLRHITGLIHVGAHVGQECDRYADNGLEVIWIEPNPKIFQTLSKALKMYPRQRALSYLVAEADNKSYSLHISNNNAASSSIFELGAHKELWPEVNFTETIQLQSITLSSLVKREQVDLNRYDALVMDTQGSELLVLKGATDILSHFRFIKTEAADFEVYKGCCTLKDLDKFLIGNGFKRTHKKPFAHKTGIGSCYDVLYART
jgi:FkbM family methyltransferase